VIHYGGLPTGFGPGSEIDLSLIFSGLNGRDLIDITLLVWPLGQPMSYCPCDDDRVQMRWANAILRSY
jgi:hypothetical protein